MNNRSARIAFAGAAVVILAAAAIAAAQRDRDGERDWKAFQKETISKTLKLADPAKPGEVVVDNVFGPVSVEGYAGQDVLLEAKKIVYARDEGRAKRAEEEVKLDITEKGNTVEIYVDGPFREDDGSGGTSTSAATPATGSTTASPSRSRSRPTSSFTR